MFYSVISSVTAAASYLGTVVTNLSAIKSKSVAPSLPLSDMTREHFKQSNFSLFLAKNFSFTSYLTNKI